MRAGARGERGSPGPRCRVDPESPLLFTTRKSLREMAERLADKYEEAKEKQEDLMNR